MMLSYKSQRTLFFIAFLGCATLNLILIGNGWWQRKPTSDLVDGSSNKPTYPFLSKRIFHEDANDVIINFIPLRSELAEYIRNNSSANTISLYFEYLPTGISIGINDREQFTYASLGKVPVVMAAYKEIERNKFSLTDKVTLREGWLDNRFGNLWKMGVGAEITVADAIKRTLRESDNTGKNLLASLTSLATINEVMESLDIPLDGDAVVDGEVLVTPKNYSSLFRSLYFSSFNTFDHSQEILDHLARSVFTAGVVDGLPEDIPYAHKVGVSNGTNDISAATYSDCGIVYPVKRQYIICIMERGSSYETAIGHMGDISRMVYGFVTGVNR